MKYYYIKYIILTNIYILINKNGRRITTNK